MHLIGKARTNISFQLPSAPRMDREPSHTVCHLLPTPVDSDFRFQSCRYHPLLGNMKTKKFSAFHPPLLADRVGFGPA